MARRKQRRKGSSKAGRPRKGGSRYPSGKLKPAGPNETVLERRKAGDASAGEHPIDFALSSGLITERQHRDAMAYRLTFKRAHVGAMGPRLALSKFADVDPSDALRVAWATMSDVEITRIFDKVFTVEPAPQDKERAEEAAMAKWKLLNTALKHSERDELFMVCVVGSWPLWMPQVAEGRALGLRDAKKKADLLNALSAVGRALRPPERGVITPLPVQHSRAGRAEIEVRYETTEGDPVTPESERGVPFEVSILRKRA